MRFLALFLLLFTYAPQSAAQSLNAGFVQGLWYSQEAVFADEPVRIYIAIRNHTGADLTGRVEFFDNGELIERNAVNALSGRIIESWADWEPHYGTHTITATLSRIELHQVGSSTQAIEVTSALAEDIIFIDYDTDKDGVGNEDDRDDDGDGISDEVEEKNGTDPLVYDEPPEESTSDEVAVDTVSETETATNPETAGYKAGLEQYLTPSPAHTALTSISETIANTKRNLDNYREERAVRKKAEADPLSITVNNDGFGEISRTQTLDREIRTPEIAKDSWAGTLISVVNSIFNVVYTALLAAFSTALGHPILLQLLLLIAILVIVYKTAKKFGSRR